MKERLISLGKSALFLFLTKVVTANVLFRLCRTWHWQPPADVVWTA